MGRHVDVINSLEDLPRSASLVPREERSTAVCQLVQENAKAPVIYTPIVASAANYLWRQIIRSATESVRLAIVDFFREAEINHDTIALPRKHDILRLEISVRYDQRVKLFKCHDDGCRVKSGRVLGELPVPFQIAHQLSAWKQIE